ncbi:MAG TPA: hypothetical protein DDY14_03850 [Chromatiaceae bacterium]|nr:MAG: hypothetical protein N838_16395 [Thiohalocapsa sp. PB-PSB1]HBG94461.1 hypothetical protein [Chromatiaceae bacterium]
MTVYQGSTPVVSIGIAIAAAIETETETETDSTPVRIVWNQGYLREFAARRSYFLMQRCGCPATTSAVCRNRDRSSWVIDENHDDDNDCKWFRDLRSRALVAP